MQLSYVMRRGDWIKLAIIVLVGTFAVTKLYTEYQTTIAQYEHLQRVVDNI
jgi:hypothetical protein